MNMKIYSVIIKGRTLESRNLKHLLARAVAEKRSADQRKSPPFYAESFNRNSGIRMCTNN